MKSEATFTGMQKCILDTMNAYHTGDVPIGVLYAAMYKQPCSEGNSVETRRVAAHVTRINSKLTSLVIVSGASRTYRLQKR